MIDLIPAVFPEVHIRLCQFHIIQAIMRWDTDESSDKKKAPGISLQTKYRIIVAFRLLQRCRDLDEWARCEAKFRQRVEDIIYDRTPDFIVSKEEDDEIRKLMKEARKDVPDDPKQPADPSEMEGGCEWSDEASDVDPSWNPAANDAANDDDDDSLEDADEDDYAESLAKRALQFDFVMKYFERNWFTDFWKREYFFIASRIWLTSAPFCFRIAMWTDIGMPKDQTRDGTWNTNNWIERAWRIIDQVFLQYRKNKR